MRIKFTFFTLTKLQGMRRRRRNGLQMMLWFSVGFLVGSEDEEKMGKYPRHF
jgi:hypothetical protein